MASHILNCLKTYQSRFSAQSSRPPLFVGVQGPQGSGKTFLTSRLRPLLADPPHSLSVAVLSIDDLYLPHSGLIALAEAHPGNQLLHGRGQPGTHDVALGRTILAALKTINGTHTHDANSDTGRDASAVSLPVFDKGLFDGTGDRAPETRTVRPPLDVLVLEGWCVGFYPIPRAEAEARWARGAVPGLDRPAFDLRAHATLEGVLEVNGMLRAYVAWWDALDAFIQIRGPPTASLAIIYRWRLQQEKDMKAKNGGRGMTDEQVKTFVDRYIPGYVFFGDGVQEGMMGDEGERLLPPWHGQGLVLELDSERQLVSTSQF